MSHFSSHVKLSATVSVSCSDIYHETENYTLISRAISFQIPWMTLCYHKKSKSKKAPQKDLVLVEICLLIMADSEHINFIYGWLVHTICILTFQVPSYMPNKDIPKKRHRNNQYWWRYCHLLLLTVATVSKTCCILTETTWTFCILTWWIGAYTYKEYVFEKTHKNIHIKRECHFLLLIISNSEQICPKMASPKGAISIFGNPPQEIS